jgi:hypothetical protein
MPDGDSKSYLMTHRPLRKFQEDTISLIPQGPGRLIGKGNLFGGVAYLGASAAQGINPIDGLDTGYNIESSNVSTEGDTKIITYRVNAWSRDVARIAAKVDAAPSMVDLGLRRVKVTSIDEETPRTTASTWRVRTEVTNDQIEQTVDDIREEAAEMM